LCQPDVVSLQYISILAFTQFDPDPIYKAGLEHFPQRYRAKPQRLAQVSAKESCTNCCKNVHCIAGNALRSLLLKVLAMRSAIIETLRKLIEHEKSANMIGSFAEAEAFAAKFQELMLTHNLTMADLGCPSPEWQEEFEAENAPQMDASLEISNQSPSWKEVLRSTLENQSLRS
jgi:hypothetical protein